MSVLFSTNIAMFFLYYLLIFAKSSSLSLAYSLFLVFLPFLHCTQLPPLAPFLFFLQAKIRSHLLFRRIFL